MPPEQGEPQQPRDEQYKTATKAAVDDALRIDVLGPRICAVLSDHTPAGRKIRELISEAITQEPAVRSAIEGVVEGLDTRRKSRWIDKGLGALGGIAVSIIAGLALYALTHFPGGSPTPTPVVTTPAIQQQAKY